MDPVNFLNRKDPRFKRLHATCDVVFRSLHEAGIGTETKSATVISKCTEDLKKTFYCFTAQVLRI